MNALKCHKFSYFPSFSYNFNDNVKYNIILIKLC